MSKDTSMPEIPTNCIYDKTDEQIAKALRQAIKHANIFVAVYDPESDKHELFYRENGKLKGTLIRFLLPGTLTDLKAFFDYLDNTHFLRYWIAKGRERYMAGEPFKEIYGFSSSNP